MGNIQEVTLAMIHDKAHKVIYNDFMLLDDNFDDEVFKGFSYTGKPIKILFVMQMMCVRGTMRIRVNLKEMVVEANDILLVAPGSIIDMVVCEGDCRMAVMHIDNAKIARQPTLKIMLQFRSVIKYECFITHFSQPAMEQMVNGYKLLSNIVNDNDLRYKDEALEGCFQMMISYWMSEIVKQDEKEAKIKISRNEQIFNTFLKLVQKNYMTNREVAF